VLPSGVRVCRCVKMLAAPAHAVPHATIRELPLARVTTSGKPLGAARSSQAVGAEQLSARADDSFREARASVGNVGGPLSLGGRRPFAGGGAAFGPTREERSPSMDGSAASAVHRLAQGPSLGPSSLSDGPIGRTTLSAERVTQASEIRASSALSVSAAPGPASNGATTPPHLRPSRSIGAPAGSAPLTGHEPMSLNAGRGPPFQHLPSNSALAAMASYFSPMEPASGGAVSMQRSGGQMQLPSVVVAPLAATRIQRGYNGDDQGPRPSMSEAPEYQPEESSHSEQQDPPGNWEPFYGEEAQDKTDAAVPPVAQQRVRLSVKEATPHALGGSLAAPPEPVSADGHRALPSDQGRSGYFLGMKNVPPTSTPPPEPSATGAHLIAAASAAAAAIGRDAASAATMVGAAANAVAAASVEAMEAVAGPTVEATNPRSAMPNSSSRPALCADPRGPIRRQVSSVLPDDSLGAAVEIIWCAEWSLRLGMDIDSVTFTKPVTKLDRESYFSVNQAVDALNRGTIPNLEDLCVAFSASSRGWYLLYRKGRQDLAAGAISGRQVDSSSVATPTVAASSAVGPGAPQPALAAGEVVRIGRSRYQITTPLGMGSFGAVWAADILDGSGEVAIKEIHCQSQQDLNNAMYEGKLLQTLSQDRGGFGGASGSSSRPLANGPRASEERIPALVATETEQLGPSHWRVRLAMSKVPGVPLDRFLDWWQRERRPLADVGPGQQLSEACHFGMQLISQLAPTFERISTHAFHRDVNSHNILVEGGDVLVPSYGLVDFGLAVDFQKWQGPGVSPASWHLVDIGGDCRYWPMAAWLQFECGWQELVKYPALASEYQTHLDLHALGITALQVWACVIAAAIKMAKRPNEGGSVNHNGDVERMPDEVVNLHAAWEAYWQDATRFWERLLDCFRNSGDQNALKGWCISEGVHNIIGQGLANVRTALREVCQVCGPPVAAGAGGAAAVLAGQRPFFSALLELVSAGGIAGVVEGQLKAPSWQSMRAVLDESHHAPRGTVPPPPGPAVASMPPQQGVPRKAAFISAMPFPAVPLPQVVTTGAMARPSQPLPMPMPQPFASMVPSPLPLNAASLAAAMFQPGIGLTPNVPAAVLQTNGRLPPSFLNVATGSAKIPLGQPSAGKGPMLAQAPFPSAGKGGGMLRQ